MLARGIIERVSKNRNFVSFPFHIPKKDARQCRLIIDYKRLRDNHLYSAPKFSLRSILTSPSAVVTLQKARWFTKIDLRDAFYSVPIPRKIRAASTFSFGNRFYVFNRLPMGHFLSPYLLPSILRSLLRGVRQIWIHIDDVMPWGSSEADLRTRVEHVI